MNMNEDEGHNGMCNSEVEMTGTTLKMMSTDMEMWVKSEVGINNRLSSV